jgi:hypothetical protein
MFSIESARKRGYLALAPQLEKLMLSGSSSVESFMDWWCGFMRDIPALRESISVLQFFPLEGIAEILSNAFQGNVDNTAFAEYRDHPRAHEAITTAINAINEARIDPSTDAIVKSFLNSSKCSDFIGRLSSIPEFAQSFRSVSDRHQAIQETISAHKARYDS